jgi:hypothetical protein
MHLATYLNDHLSGATAAVDLLEHLERSHADLAPALAALRRDIELDRRELEALIGRLGASRSRARQAAGWVAEKLARLKMTADDLSGHELKLLEAVAVGVHGKGTLWQTLKVIPAAGGPDYDRLAARAEEQRQRIEPVRLNAARAAFGG